MNDQHQRYRVIVTTLARHGFGVLDDEIIKHGDKDHVRAVHLRLACEELGTMFIKLGQLLSTRGDLLSDPYLHELAKLQSDVLPVSLATIRDTIKRELKSSPEELFSSFEDKPLGSASIGQVHAATLKDGREVVVKVRKPGVDRLVSMDLEIVAGLIDTWSTRFPILVQYNAKNLLRDFGDTLREELQYSHEAANITFFKEYFEGQPGFFIPEAIKEYSIGSVITEPRVGGRKASAVTDLPEARRKVIAARIARFVLEPAFELGVFHADPHAGNLLIQDDDTLAVIDFGKVGRLTSEERRQVSAVFVAISRSDAQRLTDSLLEITSPRHPVDRVAIAAEIDRMLALYVNVSLGNIHFGNAISELLVLVRKHCLYLPGHVVLFFKALAMCEGLLETIDPTASFEDYLKPLIGKILVQGVAGKEEAERLGDSALDALELTVELPRRIGRVLAEAERGNLRVWTRIEDIEPLMKRFEHLVSRTNATILAAASIIGLSVIMQFYHPHRWESWIGIVFWIVVGSVIIDYARTLWNLKK